MSLTHESIRPGGNDHPYSIPTSEGYGLDGVS